MFVTMLDYQAVIKEDKDVAEKLKNFCISFHHGEYTL